MSEKHLYEFSEGGFYAAASKQEAYRFYDDDCGEAGLAADDFRREVPDDEFIEVIGESPDEQWGDPREYQKVPTRNGEPVPGHPMYWHLSVTAREWANELTHGEGHVFGGDG